MANQEQSYFFPPQWNFHVGGPIALGNLLSNPKDPHNAINDEDKEPLPKLIIDDIKPDYEAVITAASAASAGISSSLLQQFGFAADVNLDRNKRRTYTINAKKLHVQEINPKPLYVEKCFNNPDVADHLFRYKAKRLYMIIGVMSVTSATVSSDVGTNNLFASKIGASFAAAGAPLDANVHGSVRNEKGAKTKFGESDFILGYKLREITYFRERKMVGEMKDVKKGTVLGDDDDGEGAAGDGGAEEGEGEMELRFVRLEEERVGAGDFEFVGVRGEVSSKNSEDGTDIVEFVYPIYEDEVDEED